MANRRSPMCQRRSYSLPSSDFNDITSGPANREGYSPGPGYDEITGLGTPKAKQLVANFLQPATFPSAVDLADCEISESFDGDFNDFMFTPQAQIMQGSLASPDVYGTWANSPAPIWVPSFRQA